MKHYQTMINKLDKCVNGYNYRVDIFKVNPLIGYLDNVHSVYAETENDAKTIADYYNGKTY